MPPEILIILLILILATALVVNHMNSRNSSVTLSEFIEQGDSEDLSLTIYFLAPNIPFRFPLSVADLIGGFYQYRITVQGVYQEDHIFDTLQKLADVELVPVKSESRVDARIHYVFETGSGQSIFDVTWRWSGEPYIIVNGLVVKENDIFFEVIKPFLPVNALNELERHLSRR